jgi:hypothetical protein
MRNEERCGAPAGGHERRRRHAPIAAWRNAGVKRADGSAFPRAGEQARLWQPV